MARHGITYHAVANAAIKVQETGQPITIERLRTLLGTGSNSTIARHLKTWQQQGHVPEAQVGLPQELVAAMKTLWTQLQDTANQAVLEMEEQTKQTIEDIKQKMAEQHGQYKNLETQHQQLAKSHEEIHQEKQHLVDTVQLHEKQQSALNAKLDTQTQQLETQTRENEKLHQHLKSTQANLLHYQQSVQTLQQQQQLEYEQKERHYQQTIKQLETALTQKSSMFENLQQQFQSLTAAQHVLTEQHENLTLQHRALTEKYQQQSIIVAEKSALLVQALQQVNEQKSMNQSQQQTIIQLEKQLTQLQSTLAHSKQIEENLNMQIKDLNAGNKTLQLEINKHRIVEKQC